MSKSLGNFYTLRDLLAKGYTGAEVRWALIGTHYRSKLNFSFGLLDQARSTLRKFSDFFGRLRELPAGSAGKEAAAELAAKADQAFSEGIGNDLGIAEALAAVFTLERNVNSALSKQEFQRDAGEIILEQFRKFNRVLGALDVDAAEAAEEIPEEILKMAEARTAARKARDFAKADELRNQMKAAGWIIEDKPGGFSIKKA